MDVGAYKGDWIAGLQNRKEFAQAHLFEPIPDHIEILNERFGNENNIFIQEYGVDRSTHTIEIAVLIIVQVSIGIVLKWKHLALLARWKRCYP